MMDTKRFILQLHPAFALLVAIPILLLCWYLYQMIETLKTTLPGFVASNWGYILIGIIVLGTPIWWRCFNAIYEHIHKVQKHNEQLLLLRAVTEQVRAGRDLSYSPDGSFKLETPTHHPSRVQVTEVEGNAPGRPALPEPADYVPEPYTFSSILERWEPNKDGILLARKHDLITVPLGEPLCHTIFTGNTDAGKTNDERLLLIQLLYLEQRVYLCDRNFQMFRRDRKLGTIYDYSQIANLLAHPPISQPQDALQLLIHLYKELEHRRDTLARVKHSHQIVDFEDTYLVFDELPAFCADKPEIMEYVGRFLREARQYGIFFIGAAQDLLNNTLNSDNGAVRENLLTNYYGGGDAKTAKITMNLQAGQRLNEDGLGVKGLKYLRAKGAGIEHTRVRVALSDDPATHTLLDDMPPFFKQATRITGPIVAAPQPTEQTTDLERALDAYDQGNTTIDALAAALGKKQHEARGLMAQVKKIRKQQNEQ